MIKLFFWMTINVAESHNMNWTDVGSNPTKMEKETPACTGKRTHLHNVESYRQVIKKKGMRLDLLVWIRLFFFSFCYQPRGQATCNLLHREMGRDCRLQEDPREGWDRAEYSTIELFSRLFINNHSLFYNITKNIGQDVVSKLLQGVLWPPLYPFYTHQTSHTT